MTYDNTNKGALFRHDKEGNDKRPDYKGKLNIEGVDYRISGWVRKPKNGGASYMHLVAEPMQERLTDAPRDSHSQAKANGYQPQPRTQPQQPEDDCDEIPF
jgi:hypothetical protein